MTPRPAPKARHQRRRQNQAARGEWVHLPPLSAPALPELPKRKRGEGRCSERVQRAWEAWRQDPARGQYGFAEVEAAIELAYVMEDCQPNPARGRSETHGALPSPPSIRVFPPRR